MYRMSDLDPMYRDRNILARNNSRKTEASGRSFSTVATSAAICPCQSLGDRELVRPKSHCELSDVDADLVSPADRMRSSAGVDDFT